MNPTRNVLSATMGAMIGCALSMSNMTPALAQIRRDDTTRTVSATVAINQIRPPVSQSFMGFSIEWSMIGGLTTREYGRQRALINLMQQLQRCNGPMVLRIGGNSEDEAAYDLPHDHGLPKFVHINITRQTLERLAALARATRCKFIIGLNLGVNRPALAVRLVRAAERIIGNQHILAFEIGNEIDSLGRFGGIWKHNTFSLCMRRWNRYAQAIRPYLKSTREIAGPAFAGAWDRDIPKFITLEHRRLCLVTLHRYPLGAPIKNPKSPAFASIAHLLGSRAARAFGPGLMQRTIAVAARYALPVRWGEMNSAYGGGKQGVSSTFASALWCADALFEAADIGAAGVNVHMSEGFDHFPGAYDPIYFYPHGPLEERPSFYGMLLFARSIENHAQIIPVSYHSHGNVKIWSTRAADGTIRVVVLNKSLHHPTVVNLRLGTTSRVTVTTLTAPSVMAVQHVNYGGQSFYGSADGKLRGVRKRTSIPTPGGRIAVPVAPCSAELICGAK